MFCLTPRLLNIKHIEINRDMIRESDYSIMCLLDFLLILIEKKWVQV